MFENFSTSKNEHPTEAEIRADFESKEKEIRKDAGNFLGNLAPEKFKEKATRALAAACLIFAATSASAGEQGASTDNLPGMGEEQISQAAEKRAVKNQVADFDWGKVVGKIEISMGMRSEDVKDFHPELLAPFWGGEASIGVSANQSEFYKGLTLQGAKEAYSSIDFSIKNSQNSNEFFKNVSSSEKGFTDKEKAFSLQQLGLLLGQTYNYDMFDSDTHVTVSSDKMFQSLKDQYFSRDADKSGICGNIHTFLTKTAQELGLEAWLQSGSTSGGGHVWSGLVLGDGAEKQIVFLDYWGLIPTGTLNYQDALGVAERYHKAASAFIDYVGNVDEVQFPVKSRAAEVIEKAAGIEDSAERLEANLEKGEIKRGERDLEIKMSPETTEIKLSSDTLALAFTNFKDVQNNPYQSLSEMSALHGSASFGGDRFGLETGVTVLHMDTKDLYSGTVSSNDIIVELAADYIDKKQLTKNEYGKFVAEFGATLEGAVKVPMGHVVKDVRPLLQRKTPRDDYAEGKGDATFGGRLVYVDPNNIGKVYVGATDVYRAQISDFQNQNFVAKEVAKNFVVGAEVKVYEGNVVKIEAGEKNLDWGKSFDVKGGVSGEKLTADVSLEKKSSDFERFIPSSEKIEVGVGYKGGPKWEVDVMGAKTTEKYKDAENKDKYSAEIKLKIMLW